MSARELATEHLSRLWRGMRNDASEPRLKEAHAALAALEAAEVFDAERVELWHRRFLTCPGHDDEGGRMWCAYCGDLDVEEGEER